MRHAARIDGNKRKIVDALRQHGAYVYDLKLPVDLMVGYKGRTILMEVKVKNKGRFTPLQNEFLDEWTGGPLWVVYSVEDAIEALGE